MADILMADISTAPWTPDQVASLNGFQAAGIFHEFTCGRDGCRAGLVATDAGWVCPRCGDHEQDWAHAFMADGSWRAFYRQFTAVLNANQGTRFDFPPLADSKRGTPHA